MTAALGAGVAAAEADGAAGEYDRTSLCTILPLGPVKQSTRVRTSSPMELHIYPGSDGRLALYEDDGVSMDHTRGVSSIIHMSWNDARKQLSLALAPGSAMRNFTTRGFRVQLAGSSEVKMLDFHGSAITIDL